MERAFENRTAKFGPEAIQADNTLHAALVKLGKKSGSTARDQLAGLRDELQAAELNSPKVVELLRLFFTKTNEVTTSTSPVSYDETPPRPQKTSKLSYQALKTLVLRVRAIFIAAGYTRESADDHIRYISDVLWYYYTVGAIEEFLNNQRSLSRFEKGFPIPDFHRWLFEQRQSVLKIQWEAQTAPMADRLFKHARDSDIHKDLMRDVEEEIGKEGLWPRARIELFCLMVSDALCDGNNLQGLREEVFVFEEPFPSFVNWLASRIVWHEDAPAREAKRNASWFLPLPPQKRAVQTGPAPEEVEKPWLYHSCPKSTSKAPPSAIPEKPFRFLDLPAEIRVWVYRELLAPTGEISLRTCGHYLPNTVAPDITHGILATSKLINKEARDIPLENKFIVTAMMTQSTRSSIHRKQLPEHLLSRIKSLTLVVDASEKLQVQAFADLRLLQAATRLEKLRICAVAYEMDHDPAREEWQTAVLDIMSRVPKTCGLAFGAVTQLEKEHVQDRAGIIDRNETHNIGRWSGGGATKELGNEVLEAVEWDKGEQGKWNGMPVDAVELRYRPKKKD